MVIFTALNFYAIEDLGSLFEMQLSKHFVFSYFNTNFRWTFVFVFKLQIMDSVFRIL